MYLGTTSANQAWLHWCDGAWDAAVQEAQAALQRWQALVYPMQWLARLPLLAIALQQGRLDDAIHEAQALLHPEQQQLPTALTAALQAAVDARMQQQSAGSVANLHQALHLAQESGHL